MSAAYTFTLTTLTTPNIFVIGLAFGIDLTKIRCPCVFMEGAYFSQQNTRCLLDSLRVSSESRAIYSDRSVP